MRLFALALVALSAPAQPAAAQVAAQPAPAQEAVRFRFAAGEALPYSVEQTTTVSETTLEEGTNRPVAGATVTKLNLTRRWDVKSVDATTGAATMELTLGSLKQTINRPGPRDRAGKLTVDQIVIDSATDEGKAQLAALLGKPIVTIQVDVFGKLLDAKSDNPKSAERLRLELPFRVTLPEALPAVGGSWERPFAIKLDPPQGTGESYEATQTYTRKPDNQGYAVIAVATAVKAPPKDPAQFVGLVPLLWEGEVYFHKAGGRYVGARLGIKREVVNHAGEGTKFTYETTYAEALQAPPPALPPAPAPMK